FDLASGLVQRAAFAQAFVGAASGCDLPDHLPPFMRWSFLETCITRIRTADILLTMQQLRDSRHVCDARRSAVNVMHQPRLNIGADMRLHAEEVLVAFLGLMHLWIALAFLVLGRTGRMDDRGIDNRALAQ